MIALLNECLRFDCRKRLLTFTLLPIDGFSVKTDVGNDNNEIAIKQYPVKHIDDNKSIIISSDNYNEVSKNNDANKMVGLIVDKYS